jgi:3-dehydroquinate synthase
MEKVRVKLDERSYDICIDRDILDGIGPALREFAFNPLVAVISNPTVYDLYGKILSSSLESAGFRGRSILIPDGEAYKDYFWSYHIVTELLKMGLNRNSCIIALGGGVIGDITGFAAALYMRGIHFVQTPTTLLAQVDSSVGGKTGVNHALGKNMIGAFYQPRLVWIDVSVLGTLPQRELLCGIAETIKYGVIWDPDLFDFMETARDRIMGLEADALAYIVRRSCEIKAQVVSEDEREGGLRAILNFGHTVGHAVETETGYTRFLHGEAVAMGMYYAARLSEETGLMEQGGANRIRDLLEAYGLPWELPDDLSADALIAHMRLDKKAEAGELRFVLPEKMGMVRIVKGVKPQDIKRALGK